jgi:hypothetical protein
MSARWRRLNKNLQSRGFSGSFFALHPSSKFTILSAHFKGSAQSLILRIHISRMWQAVREWRVIKLGMRWR